MDKQEELSMKVEQNQNTNPNIILSVLRHLTGLKFKSAERHMNPETSVNVQMSPRVKEPLSTDVNLVNRQAGIDKADCRLYEAVSVEAIKARAEELGLPLRYMKIGQNKKQVLRIGDPNGEHIYLRVRHGSDLSWTVLTNPNKFYSAERYFQFLAIIFGINHFESMKLIRLDFNVDLPEHFNVIRSMLRVKHKQLNKRHEGRSSLITGLNFGGGDESLCAYNKAYQVSKNDMLDGDPRSRIEIRLKGKRLPVTYVHELPKLIKNTNYGHPFKPFHFLYLEPFILADESSIKDPKKLRKLIHLKGLIEASGIDYAIRQLNQNGNFARDYKGLIEFQESPYDLDDILLNGLFEFFGKRRPIQL